MGFVHRLRENRRAHRIYTEGLNLVEEQHRPREGLEKLREGLVVCRETGNRHGEAMTLCAIGTALYFLGETDESIAHYRRGADVAHEQHDRAVESHALNQLGAIYERLDMPSEAQEHFARALALIDMS